MTERERLLTEERFKAEDENFKKSLIEYINGTIDRTKPVIVGKTPLSLSLTGANKELNLEINVSTIRKCMSSPHEYYHGHDLDLYTMAQLPKHLRNPIMLIKGSDPNAKDAIVALSELRDSRNKNIVVVVNMNTTKGRHQVNEILTAYGRDRLKNYLSTKISEGEIIAYNKKKADNIFQSLGLQSPQEETLISYDDSIAYTLENVNYPSEKNSEKEVKTNMENKTELIDDFVPEEVIEPKKEYIGTMNYRNIKDPVTYKSEHDMGLAIAEKLKQSNIRFSAVVEDKSVSISFEKKYIKNYFAIKKSVEKPQGKKPQEQLPQGAEIQKPQEPPTQEAENNLKTVLFRRTNELYEKFISSEQNDVSETEKRERKNAFDVLYDILKETNLGDEYQAWKKENVQEKTEQAADRATDNKQKSPEKKRYIGNTSQKRLTDPVTFTGSYENGLAIVEGLKAVGVKVSGIVNEDNTVSVSFDRQHTKTFYAVRDNIQKTPKSKLPPVKQETEKAAKAKNTRESAYFGNTLAKFVPNKQYIKELEKTVGIEVSAKLKQTKVKHSGQLNKDGTITITYDGTKTEEVSRIVAAAQTSVSYSAETRSQGQVVSEQPVAETVSTPSVPDTSYTESTAKNEVKESKTQTPKRRKSSLNNAFNLAEAAKASYEKSRSANEQPKKDKNRSDIEK